MSEILKKTKQPSKQSKPKFRSKELKPAKKEMEEEMQDGALIEDQKMINTLVPVNDEAIVIDDPGWESDLDIDDIINKKVTKDPYISACEEFGAVPVTMIVQRLESPEICLVNHGIGPAGERALAKVLQSNSTVLRLDLTGNCINGNHLFTSLAQNRTITYLNLSRNNLKQATTELVEFFSRNTTITTLLLAHSNLGDSGAAAIAEGLTTNQTIKVLDISYNQIGDIGASALGKALAGNHNLEELDLSFNEIRTKGLSAFLTGAKDSTSLQNLSIAKNGIGETLPALLPFLQKSPVCRLSIAYTRIGESPLSLLVNAPLQELDLGGNTIPAPILQSLFKAISGSKITKIGLKNVRYNKEMAIFIEGLKKEATLKIDD